MFFILIDGFGNVRRAYESALSDEQAALAEATSKFRSDTKDSIIRRIRIKKPSDTIWKVF